MIRDLIEFDALAWSPSAHENSQHDSFVYQQVFTQTFYARTLVRGFPFHDSLHRGRPEINRKCRFQRLPAMNLEIMQ